MADEKSGGLARFFAGALALCGAFAAKACVLGSHEVGSTFRAAASHASGFEFGATKNLGDDAFRGLQSGVAGDTGTFAAPKSDARDIFSGSATDRELRSLSLNALSYADHPNGVVSNGADRAGAETASSAEKESLGEQVKDIGIDLGKDILQDAAENALSPDDDDKSAP